MMFIYTIHPTSFNYGILLHVNEQSFTDFTDQSAYKDRHNGKFNKYSCIMRFGIV